jgi:hypothetical protein
MMRLVEVLRRDHSIGIVCPAASHMAEVADRACLPLYKLPAVDASLRLDPVWTPVGLGQLALGGAALRRAARHFGADVVHANSCAAVCWARSG